MDFTDRSWLILQEAREEAFGLGDTHIGSDHILLAMLRDGDGAAAFVLEELGIDYEDVRALLTV